MVEHEQAPNNDKTNMVFMTMVEVEGQLFTDQTDRFPVTSNRGNNYIVIFYAVDPNYIKSYPIKSRHRTKLLKAYEEVYQLLRIRGYRPQLHTLDNETSKDVETFIAENNAKFQYTPPDMHCTNTAERAIRKSLRCNPSRSTKHLPSIQLVQRSQTNRYHTQHATTMHNKSTTFSSGSHGRHVLL